MFVLNGAGQGLDQIFNFKTEAGDKLKFVGVASNQIDAQALGADLSVTVDSTQVALLMEKGTFTLNDLMAHGHLIFAQQRADVPRGKCIARVVGVRFTATKC